MRTSIVLAAFGLTLACPPAFAQIRSCPAGQQWVVARVSKITGTQAGFDDAVHDHIKWYRDHGYKANTIIAGPVMERSGGGEPVASKDLVLSLHIDDPGVPAEKYDDAWAAYVAKYKANSVIVSETSGCLPKSGPACQATSPDPIVL